MCGLHGAQQRGRGRPRRLVPRALMARADARLRGALPAAAAHPNGKKQRAPLRRIRPAAAGRRDRRGRGVADALLGPVRLLVPLPASPSRHLGSGAANF